MSKGTVWVIGSLSTSRERWEQIASGADCSLHFMDALGLTLANLRESEIDVVVVDTRAQSEDGLDLCRRLHGGFENPVILVAFGSDEEYCVRAYEVGVDECIATAVTDELLSAKLKAWLRWSARTDTGAEGPHDGLASVGELGSVILPPVRRGSP